MLGKKATKRNNESSGSSVAKRKDESTSESLSEKKFKTGNDENVPGNKQCILKCTNQRKAIGSILHFVYNTSLGQNTRSIWRQAVQQPFVRSLASYGLRSTASPFDRRVTCLEWHPTHPTALAVGSKGGDLVLWDYERPDKMSFVKGDGAGDSITSMRFNPRNASQLFLSSIGGTTTLRDFSGTVLQVFVNTETWEYPDGQVVYASVSPTFFSCVGKKGACDFIGGMKFCPSDLSKVYTASGDGSLTVRSFQGLPSLTLSRTQDCGHTHHNVCYWYCCVDVSVSRQMLATGDNRGRLVLLGLDGHKIFNDKLHKDKVTHAEFNSRCDWLLATASVDRTVKLWDLRNLKDKKSFLHEMQHSKGVNSAYFNPTDSTKILTTDQNDEIRVYTSSDWSKPELIVQHPHRQFQHITSIKATWHPVYDLIVAGRYPDNKIKVGDVRSVDIFDANSGDLVCQMQDPNTKGIISLNKFNPLGDVLASGMGCNILVWKMEEVVNDMQKEALKSTEKNRSRVAVSRRRATQQQSTRNARRPAEDLKLKKKIASLESETKSRTRQNRKK